MPIDTDIHEQAAAYALDALDGSERRAFETHLDGCERCRAEVASFADAVLTLAAAAGGPEPPAGLRDRVLGAARAEPPAVVVLAAVRERRRSAQLLLRPQVLAPAFAAAAAAAVALGIWGAGVSGSLDRERVARRAEASALAAFADPAASRTASGNAALAVAGGRGALSLVKLPPAPAGKTYQAWVIPPGQAPIPAGLFDVRGGRAVIVLEPTVGPGAIVAITLEAAGGVAAPTGKPLLAVKTSAA
jgi:anti-sigma-K factor RskA